MDFHRNDSGIVHFACHRQPHDSDLIPRKYSPFLEMKQEEDEFAYSSSSPFRSLWKTNY
ncbi:hypothetical protein J25TS5_12110 [Paenibacillus faecis]|nr:hypothetical protein J25TS5_12110 [Paenibacillus faecis]